HSHRWPRFWLILALAKRDLTIIGRLMQIPGIRREIENGGYDIPDPDQGVFWNWITAQIKWEKQSPLPEKLDLPTIALTYLREKASPWEYQTLYGLIESCLKRQPTE